MCPVSLENAQNVQIVYFFNHLTPKYLSDTLQSYQTQHRYSTHTAANHVQLKYPTANKYHIENNFLNTIRDCIL